MEELGIGRPSTYASILQVLQDRGYVRLDKKRLIPEDKGRVRRRVPGKLLRALCRIRFHRRPRRAARPDLQQRARLASDVLRDFWQRLHRRRRRHQGSAHHARCSTRSTRCCAPHLFPPKPGRHRSAQVPELRATAGSALKLGRFGAFIGCSNYPECKFTRQLSAGADGSGGGMRKLGEDPDTGLDVTVARPLRHLPAARRSHQGRDGEA